MGNFWKEKNSFVKKPQFLCDGPEDVLLLLNWNSCMSTKRDPDIFIKPSNSRTFKMIR